MPKAKAHTSSKAKTTRNSHVAKVNPNTIAVTPHVKESIAILHECAQLQERKSRDYQNPNSRIRQANYYPRGVASILDIIQAKVLRMYSVIEAMENDPGYQPNFESIEDSGKDLINYSSFLVAYMRGKVDGQEADRDFLNRRQS
jgi:hypothetical protein